ncbi:MAG: hypothetical protein J6O51_00785 [Bacteroidales bacterium]|nr:hypothetical protein [Bacteroidales bacterium]
MKDFFSTAALVFTGFLLGALCAFIMAWKTASMGTMPPHGQAAADSICTSTPPVAVRRDTVWLPTIPLPIKIPGKGNLPEDSALETQNSPEDSAGLQVFKDSALVAIPIVEQLFEGEYYKAVVQGFRPVLKSIEIKHPEPPAPAHKWWSVTIGPQVGYGFTPAGWQPYAGIGVTIGLNF